MTKIFKKTSAVLTAAIITLVSLCITAFAATTPSYTIEGDGSNGTTDATIEYENVNSQYTRVSYNGIDLFVTGSGTTYTVTFTPSANAATTVCFCDNDSTNEAATIIVPKWTSGMPSTFSTTVTLQPNYYYAMKMKSNSSSATTSGRFTVHGLARIY